MEPPTEPNAPGAKPKPLRTEAQKAATAKMLQSLQERRRAEWEQKKATVLSKYKDKIKEVVSEPAMEKPIEKPKPVVEAPLPVAAAVDLEALKQQIKAEMMAEQKAKKPKRKIVVESDSDSEEEVVITRKKKKASPAPKAAPAKPAADPLDELKSLFLRHR